MQFNSSLIAISIINRVFLPVCLLLRGVTHVSATTTPRRRCQASTHPSQDDLPSGVYDSGALSRLELGNITSVRMSVEHLDDVCRVNTTFTGRLFSKSFYYPVYKLASTTLLASLRRRGIARCFYFPKPCNHEMSALISSETDLQKLRGVSSVLLCTETGSTNSKADLVLYLDAIRGPQKHFIDLRVPVHLTLGATRNDSPSSSPLRGKRDTQQHSSGSSSPQRGASANVGEAPRKRPRLTHTSSKRLKDGHYYDFFTIIDVKTGDDGGQRVELTSTTDDLELVIIDGLLIPAEDPLAPGCFRIDGTTRSGLRLCPNGDVTLILKGLGQDRPLVLVSKVQL